MGDRPELARLATDLLAAEPMERKKVSVVEEERAIAAIESAIERLRTQRRVRAVAFAGVFVVAAAAALFFVLRTSAPVVAASDDDDDDDIILTDGAERIGDRIVTHDGLAVIAAKNGSRVRIDAHGDVDLERSPASRKLDLHAGALEARVAKLSAGHRFVVTTADAEIEVRGTAFRVAVSEHTTCGARTSVSVTEGTVWVRFHGSESVVAAGGSWPKCEAALAPPSPSIDALGSAPAFTAPVAKAPAVETVSASVLAEQNRMFEEAIAAKRSGDVAAAVSGFERVTQGPLAESAAAERFRVLAAAKDSRAPAAARDYLAHYPNGFAQGEARAILRP